MVTYPKDWDIVALGTKCEITSSKRVFESEWEKHGIPFLRTRDIASFHAGEEQKDKLFISEKTYREKTAVSGEPHKGDLLVTGVGTIGLPYLVPSDDKMYFKDGNILWIKKSDAFVPEYLFLQFLSKETIEQIQGSSGFTTVGTFTIKNAKKLSMPMPCTKEQRAIAETLKVFDTHIANLAELIEKKKAIRDGVLEDLVTGRTRLAGFNEEWIDTTVNDVTQDVIAGGTPSTSHPEYWGGTIPWLASTEIHQKMLDRETTHITELGLANSSAKIAPAESVLIALAGQGKTRGTAAFLLRPMALNQSLAALVSNEKMSPKFLFYLMESMYLSLREVSSGDGGRGGLNKKLLKKVSIRIPIDVDEQKTIADVLTAMDKEIKDLEDERDKMIQIREGAMDDLLTGRVRLTV